MTPKELLAGARKLVDDANDETSTLWARASSMLTRQALEATLSEALSHEAPGAQAAPFTTQLVVLRSLHPETDLPARTAYTWSALSNATHYQGYELPPTAADLRGWIETVEEMVAVFGDGRNS